MKEGFDERLREERREYRLSRMDAEAVLRRVRGLPKGEREAVEEKLRRIAALARSLGQDFDLKLEPGEEWRYDFETNTIQVPLSEVREKPAEYLLACAIHEAGHRRISRATDRWFFRRESRRLLFNGVEDPRANNWMMREYAGVREHYFLPFYKETLPSDPASPLLWSFPFLLPHVQFVIGLIHRWAHGEDHPLIAGDDEAIRALIEALGDRGDPRMLPAEVLGELERRAKVDEKVREALEKAWPIAREIWKILPESDNPNEREIWEAAQEAARRIREELWPIYEELLEEAIALVEEGLRRGTIRIDEEGLPGGLSVEDLPEWARELVEGASRSERIEDLPPEESSRLARALVEAASKRVADVLEPRVERPDLERTREVSGEGEFDIPELVLEPPPSRLESFVAWEAERVRAEQEFRRYARRTASPYGRYLAEVAGLVDELAGFLEAILKPNLCARKEGFFRSGTSIHIPKYLQERGSGSPDRAIFLRRTKPAKRDYRFSLLLDESGSMRDGRKDFNAICAVVLFLEVLERLRIDFEIAGFHSTHLVHKEFGRGLSASDKEELIAEIERMMGGGATHDVEAIELALDRMKQEPAREKFILVVTDGMGNGPGSMPEAIARAEEEGVHLVGIGVGEGTGYVREQYEDHMVVNDVGDLPVALAAKLERLILFGV